VNEHNGRIPRDFWLEDEERTAIVAYHDTHPLEGYRRLTYMMLDHDIVAVSPSTVYRVLKDAGRLDRKWNKPSRKGTGFVQPLQPHEHWHIDMANIKVAGIFYYLTTILDGCSRFVVHWELRESMTEQEIEVILQRARERSPDNARPRIISDNGPQFIARDFGEFIRMTGLTHVRTSPYYPQSNGKLERYHRTIKENAIRPGRTDSLENTRRIIEDFVAHYNESRLHSALGYVTPRDRLQGRHEQIQQERDRKLETAREQRRQRREIPPDDRFRSHRGHDPSAFFPRRPPSPDHRGAAGKKCSCPPECDPYNHAVPRIGEPFAGQSVAYEFTQLSDFR